MNLKKLLKPRKIAIVGASDKETLGGFSVKLFLNNSPGRSGDLFLVSKNRKELYGKKCYQNLSSIKRAIDLVIVCTPKNTVEKIVQEAADTGAKGIIVFASGYSETGKISDVEQENRLKKLCEEKGLALMGPNCAGYLNFIDQIYAFGFLVDIRIEPGKIALLSQSGQVCTSLLDSPKASFSYLISSGNSKIVTIEDYMEFLIEDENTKVISIYLEGVSKPEKFIKNLKTAAAKKKPVVILKAGRSEKGRQAAASHTGSLTGSNQCFDAIFKKFGVIRVDDMEELISTSSALELIPELPRKNAFVAVNASGGETAICADICAAFGLNFPELEENTLTKLNEFLPDYATARNPLDTTANVCYDSNIYASVLDTALSDPNVEAMIIGLTITENADYASTYHMTNGIEKFMRKGNRKPIFIIPVIESGRDRGLTHKMRSVGVPILPPHSYAFKVIQNIIEYSQYNTKDKRLEPAIPEKKINRKIVLSEHESKKMLKCLGIPIPEEKIAENEKDALRITEQIGFPVVMKIDSSDILHKTDAGGVILSIKNINEARQSYREILENVRNYNAKTNINGVLIQKMLPKGLETIIGVKSDPLFGPMVMFGIGGVFVEMFEDVCLYPVPFGKTEAFKMINSLNSSELFHGYRNQAELDVDELAIVLVNISEFAARNKNVLLEMDINPLVVYEKGKGVVALDALIIADEGRFQV